MLMSISPPCLLLLWAEVQLQVLEAKHIGQIPVAIPTFLQDTGRTWLFLFQSAFHRLDSLGLD